MPASERIYLDNAATSFPKPGAVYDAVDEYNRRIGAAFGRGAFQEAIEVQRIVDRCRKRVAEIFGAADIDHVIFTFNGTDSLNLAIHGVLAAGDHVVTSELEHNSVLRPLRELSSRAGVEVTQVATGDDGRVDPSDVRKALRPNTKLVAVLHASNVTGVIQPIAEIGEIARSSQVLFLVDAAQTAGHLPIDLRQLNIDLLACPGHKGLLGPLGTGLLILKPGVEARLKSLRQGGTGSRSEEDRQPDVLPDKYESGNHNAPGLFGLEAALDWIQKRGVESLHAHEQELTSLLIEGLAGVSGLTVHAACAAVDRVGVVSISHPVFESQVLASILDGSFQIQTRAGVHCAPGAHRRLGTLQTGGTVRLSVGPFTTPAEIDAAVAACREIVGSMKPAGR